jgi:hypothetical protein
MRNNALHSNQNEGAASAAAAFCSAPVERYPFALIQQF